MATRELRTSEPDLPAGEERVGHHRPGGTATRAGVFWSGRARGARVCTEYHLQVVQREARGDHEEPKIQLLRRTSGEAGLPRAGSQPSPVMTPCSGPLLGNPSPSQPYGCEVKNALGLHPP